WLDQMGLTLDEFENYIVETLIYEEMQSRVVNEESVNAYFKLNSPRFDAILLSHIVVDSENKARELVAILEDEPDMFEELAREHSMADTQSEGGYIGRVTRGSMVNDVEAKVFNAGAGEVLGPYPAVNESLFEIFLVNDRRDAQLDSATESEIQRALKEEWLAAQAKEFVVEVC
ncbi:MAG: peptidylprolyl isomerase, partial [Pseudomonadota bacterium]